MGTYLTLGRDLLLPEPPEEEGDHHGERGGLDGLSFFSTAFSGEFIRVSRDGGSPRDEKVEGERRGHGNGGALESVFRDADG